MDNYLTSIKESSRRTALSPFGEKLLQNLRERMIEKEEINRRCRPKHNQNRTEIIHNSNYNQEQLQNYKKKEDLKFFGVKSKEKLDYPQNLPITCPEKYMYCNAIEQEDPKFPGDNSILFANSLRPKLLSCTHSPRQTSIKERYCEILPITHKKCIPSTNRKQEPKQFKFMEHQSFVSAEQNTYKNGDDIFAELLDGKTIGKMTEEENGLFDVDDSPLLLALNDLEKDYIGIAAENDVNILVKNKSYENGVNQMTPTSESPVIKQSENFKSIDNNPSNGKRKGNKIKNLELYCLPEHSKKCKKFDAPLKKALIQTKLLKHTDKTQVIELNKASLEDMRNQIIYSTPLEICCTMLYASGKSQLSDPDCCDSYNAILLRIQWQLTDVEYCSISNQLWKNEKPSVRKFFKTALDSETTFIALEAGEIMAYFIQKFEFDKETTMRWKVVDPYIAYWLLNPDDPCSTFESLADALHLKKNEIFQSYNELTKSCKYSNLLSECFHILKRNLMEEELWSIFMEIEVRLTPILARMTQRGLSVDEAQLRDVGGFIKERLTELENEAQKLAGQPFLLTSTQQLRRVLYDDLELDRKANLQVKGTATLGLKSTSEAVLRKLAESHPLPGVALEYRRLHKLKTTFVDGLLVFIKKGVINTVWGQRSASTGRLASSNPSLQTIPKQWFTIVQSTMTSHMINIRSAFLPRPGYVFVLADLKQIEFRIFAHLAQDPGIIEIFHQSDDVFMSLAEKWVSKERTSVNESDRNKTKHIFYALMYGAGPAKLCEILNVSLSEATAIFNSFCASFPVMKRFTNEMSQKCFIEEKLKTLQGRVRKFPNIKSTRSTLKSQAERQALNFIIQGTAADMCKKAMLKTEEVLASAIPPVDAHLLLQIHDELIWEVRQAHVDSVKKMVRKVMEDDTLLTGNTLSVPIRVKIAVQSTLATPQNQNTKVC